MPRNTTISGCRFPAEILLNIARYIDNSADFSRLTRCSRATYQLFNTELWLTGWRRPGKPALYHAIERNNLALATTALARYRACGATGLLDGTAVRWGTFALGDDVFGDDALPTSPVILAVEHGNMAMVKLLVQNGCSVTVRRRRHADSVPGWGMHERCVPEMCRGLSLLQGEGQGSSADDCCESALHAAVWAGQPDILLYLLENGADVGYRGLRNEQRTLWDCTVPIGESVLAYAESKGYFEYPMDETDMQIIEVLEDFGVQMDRYIQRHLIARVAELRALGQ